MRGRDFIAGLASMGVVPAPLRAQSGARRYRVGMLDTSARRLNSILVSSSKDSANEAISKVKTSSLNTVRRTAAMRASPNWPVSWCV
jgi:hypothetical protein